jgi:hypothetical protein
VKNVSQNSRSPSLDLNPEPPEYKEVLTTRPQHSVRHLAQLLFGGQLERKLIKLMRGITICLTVLTE